MSRKIWQPIFHNVKTNKKYMSADLPRLRLKTVLRTVQPLSSKDTLSKSGILRVLFSQSVHLENEKNTFATNKKGCMKRTRQKPRLRGQ
jgi:hypothetical protein